MQRRTYGGDAGRRRRRGCEARKGSWGGGNEEGQYVNLHTIFNSLLTFQTRAQFRQIATLKIIVLEGGGPRSVSREVSTFHSLPRTNAKLTAQRPQPLHNKPTSTRICAGPFLRRLDPRPQGIQPTSAPPPARSSVAFSSSLSLSSGSGGDYTHLLAPGAVERGRRQHLAPLGVYPPNALGSGTGERVGLNWGEVGMGGV